MKKNFIHIIAIGLLFTATIQNELYAQRNKGKVPASALNMDNPRSEEIQRMFIKAVGEDDTTKMKLLIENGASTNYRKIIGKKETDFGTYNIPFPLVYAVHKKAFYAAKFLVELDRRSLLSKALAVSIEEKDLAMSSYLMRETFNPNTPHELNDVIKSVALSSDLADVALSSREIHTLNQLIEYGVTPPSQPVLNAQLSAFCKGGKNAVDYCLSLIKMGADPNYQTKSGSKELPIYCPVLIDAATTGCVEMQKMLIENGAKINATQQGIWSVLSINVEKPNNLEFIKWLIEHGADINFRGRAGRFDSTTSSILQRSREEYKEFLVINGAR